MPKLLNSVSTLYTNLPFRTRLPVPPIYSTLLNHNSQVYFPWDPLFTLPLQSCFQGSLAIWSWDGDMDVLSLLRSQQQQDIMPDNFMLSWLDMVMTLPVMKVVIFCHPCTKKTPIYTIFGVITVFPKLTDTKPLPRSWFSCRTDQTSKHLFQPTTSPSMSILNKKKTWMFHLAIFHIFLEPFPGIPIPCSFHQRATELWSSTKRSSKTLLSPTGSNKPTVVTLAGPATYSCRLACLQKPWEGQSVMRQHTWMIFKTDDE